MSTAITSSVPKSILHIPYTGTKDQPDTVTLFSSQGKDLVQFYDEETINAMGHSPYNYRTAIIRIQLSAEKILSEVRLGAFRENSELGNAFKNFFRGVVQLVPLAGNGALYAYDYLKRNLYTHSLIPSQIPPGDHQMGIAFDGKVIATFTYAQFNRYMKINKQDSDTKEVPVALLGYAWASFVIEIIKNDSSSSKREIALHLARGIQRA